MDINPLIVQAMQYVRHHFVTNVPNQYIFHNINHVEDVVKACHELADQALLSEKDRLLLQLAAWFHDVGYSDGPEGHEERSAQMAQVWLEQNNATNDLSASDIDTVKRLILVTKMPQQPHTHLEKLICDGDLSHLGKKKYWERGVRLRQELAVTKGIEMSELEWLDFEFNFLRNHRFKSKEGALCFGERKSKNLAMLEIQRQHILDMKPVESTEEVVELLPEDKALLVSGDNRPTRGIETMYRTTYRTHTNLSAIADNKANIMLSVTAIVISVVLSALVPNLSKNPHLTIPTLLLLATCLIAMVYAVLATRPSVTEGKYQRADIDNRTANLLFFGNFHAMPLGDFQYGMNEMLKDKDFLYNSMTKDIYYLGKVLAKKYHYLSVCYTVFMYGLIASVIAYIIAFTGILH